MNSIPTQTCDVLIIGSGGSGLRAAIELFDNGVDVLVVGKCEKREAHTKVAAGGINAALGNMDPEDSWELHAADTIRDGDFINDPRAVELLCENAPRAIEELDEWGVPFNKDETGMILQRFFGAARYRRSCFVKDITGKAILDALVDQVEQRGIRFESERYITALLHREGTVNGALGVNLKTGELMAFQAKAVVLATGGHSRMFKRSSSHFWENNGDGIKLAYDLGATFMDMEMFQFHPTGMVYPPEADGLLVTEAVRGEGGILTNANGERFMEKYDPERMELSARDIVARANYLEILEGRGTERGGVYLDISHKSKEYIQDRLMNMYDQFQEYMSVDISKEKMEVAPTAHYSMGGVFIDHETGETGIPGLFAIGEVTAGVHGGNRLGGNSLAEILVFGRLTAEHMLQQLPGMESRELDEAMVKEKAEEIEGMFGSEGEDPMAVKKELQQLMWEHVGVIRTGQQMREGLEALDRFRSMRFKIGAARRMNEAFVAALNVRNMVPVCEMILRAALQREESRGAHYRTDFPESRSEWLKNILCKPEDDGSIKFWTRDVPAIPESIKAVLTDEELELHFLE